MITKRICRTLITKRLCHYNNYRGKLTELISVPFKVIKSALEGAKDVLHGFKISIDDQVIIFACLHTCWNRFEKSVRTVKRRFVRTKLW